MAFRDKEKNMLWAIMAIVLEIGLLLGWFVSMENAKAVISYLILIIANSFFALYLLGQNWNDVSVCFVYAGLNLLLFLLVYTWIKPAITEQS